MRIIAIYLAIALLMGTGHGASSQAPEVVAAARRAAFPVALTATEPRVSLLLAVRTTALGCRLIAGVPLPDPIESYRLEFELDGAAYAVHASADGSLTQVCDERYPKLGKGVMPVYREASDSDGDGLQDSVDPCPQIAGAAKGEGRGCVEITASDSDGDGSGDPSDRCPNQAGSALTEGCALFSDEDGDGVPDHIDICPSDAGVIRADFALGCPADGSGASALRRATEEACHALGSAVPIYARRTNDAQILDHLDQAQSAEVTGRAAALDWYQVGEGWVRAERVELSGACYNIPLVNPAVGGATGCYMRPHGDFANVRAAPGGRQVARLYAKEPQAVLGASFSGGWLYYRAGWVNRATQELSGHCERLPVLDPAQVSSGVVHYCPPGYEGFLPPRISLGSGNARIASATLANRLRAEPDYRSELLAEIPPGRVIDAIVDGPACQAPFVWWQVEVAGQIGWTVESDINAYAYYLEPAASVDERRPGDADRSLADAARKPSSRLIHSANINRLDTIALINLPAPSALAWSPRQRRLAALTGAGELALFDGTSFQPVSLDLPLAKETTAIAFSPDANWLALGAQSGSISIAAMTDGLGTDSVRLPGALAGPIRALAWSPAGDKLAAAGGAEDLQIVRRAGALKLWQISPDASAADELLLHFAYPYPLTAIAFSRDGKWLAASGESTVSKRAALWVYDSATGSLVIDNALAPTRGYAFVIASPADELDAFVYSSGDSLFQLNIEAGASLRFFHRAGSIATGAGFRPQVIAGAEALMAVGLENGVAKGELLLTNALNPYAPAASFALNASDFAFSPDGRFVAVADRAGGRIRILGVPSE